MKKNDSNLMYCKTAGLYGVVVGTVLALAACGGSSGGGGDENGDGSASEGDDAGSASFSATELQTNTADTVIAGIYDEQATQAQEMEDAVKTLVDEPNNANLEAARAEWVDTRIFWERSESFLFGPVDSEGIDPRIDDWPLDESKLDDVLAGNSADDIDEELIDSFSNNLRGFHVVEFLLWSDSNDGNDDDDPTDGQDSLENVVSALSDADRAKYLKEATIDLRQQSERLRNAWDPADSENFGSQLKAAGDEGNNTFPSQRAAVQQIIDGMIIIADEVGAGKISDPFGGGNNPDPLIVESKHSFNSRTDFRNNIRGIKHIYLGDFPFQTEGGEDGVGVTDFVQEFGSDTIDQDIRTQIDFAIEQIKEIDQPFRDSISGGSMQRTKVQNAIDAVIDLRTKLEQDVVPLLDEADFAQ